MLDDFSRRATATARLVAMGAGLSACATATSSLPPLPPRPAVVDTAPPALAPYRVQVGDVLDIKLMLNPELNEQVTVRPDGMISTALVENVRAYGRIPTAISADLREAYGNDLKDPRLTVVVRTFAPSRIYVAGEVTNPGEFVTVGPNLTLAQAVARAGGVKLSGDRGRVFVIRRGPNDEPQAFSVDLEGVISGETPNSDARLAPYDVVYVPRTGVYEVWTFWNQFVQQFLPVSWGFSYSVNPRND